MKIILFLVLTSLSIQVIGQNDKVEAISKLYMEGRFKEAINLGQQYLADDPQNIDYHLIIGRALVDSGNYTAAIPFLKNTVEHDPNNSWRKAWALSYLGNSYFMTAEAEKSKSAIRECMEINATKNATRNAYKSLLLFGFEPFFDNWKTMETDHFRFHFQTLDSIEVASYIQAREDGYQQINDFFGSTLPKKIDFFVWNSREDARKVLHSDLGFANPEYCVVHSFFKQTIGHEMTHVISHYAGSIRNKTGLINEGTAVNFDLSNQDRQQMVEDWLKLNTKTVKVEDMWKNWSDYQHELSYPLSGLFISMLIENFGREEFLRFFADQSYEHARLIFGDRFDELVLAFEQRFKS